MTNYWSYQRAVLRQAQQPVEEGTLSFGHRACRDAEVSFRQAQRPLLRSLVIGH